MTMVKGMVELCTSNLSQFTSLEGVGGFPLYHRYGVLRDIIKVEISPEYAHFFAQPVVLDDVFTWYSVPFSVTPQRFEELGGGERDKYEKVKNKTISHFQSVIEILKQKNKIEDVEYLEKALKYIDDRFIYCFDEKVVLAIWGMKPRIGKNRISGEFATDLFVKVPKYKILFIAGEHGIFNSSDNFLKEKDSRIQTDEIPSISVIGEFEFTRWDPNPENYTVTENTTFNAQYRPRIVEKVIEEKIEEPIIPPFTPIEEQYHKVTFSAGKNGQINGNSVFDIKDGDSIATSVIPSLDANKGYTFKGWDKNPVGYKVNNNTEFVALYDSVIPKRGFWGRLWDWILAIPSMLLRWWKWLWGSGCLNWLIGLLLILLLIWLLSYLFKDCSGHNGRMFGGGNNNTIGNGDGNRNGNGGEKGDGSRRDDGRTGKDRSGGYENLPENPGVIAPVDPDDFGYSKDSLTRIVSDRLNVLIDGKASIAKFATDFKATYPSDDYQIVYYDTLINRLQIKVPEQKRETLKRELPQRLSKYKLFIWDETLFESNVQLNDPSLSDKNKRWYLDAIQAPTAWNISLGSANVIVAIVDNGFNLKHPEFKDKIVKPYNVWSKNSNVVPSKDMHGTHVAGIALALANNSIGMVGIAPNCKFMPVQVADAQGNMTISSIVDGVLYAIYSGADVVNVSLGMDYTDKAASLSLGIQNGLIRNNFKEEERLWNEVFRIADQRNATIVIAAGNNNLLAGIDPMHRPSHAITVSAVDKANSPYSKSSFSNYGEFSTVSAPGVQIYSTIGDDSYRYLDGTSMASPIVTGAVALLKSKNKKLSSSMIKNILITTGIPVRGNVGNMIQLAKALNAAGTVNLKDGKCVECDKINREVDSLKREIEKRKQKCPKI